DLVDVAAVGGLPVAPLLAIDRAEITCLVGPFVPDADVAILQPIDVGIAAKEPQELDDDRAKMQLLRRQKRETVGQIEAHLRSEPGQGAGPRAVLLLDSAVEDQLHEVEILVHSNHNLIQAAKASRRQIHSIVDKTWCVAESVGVGGTSART